MVEPEETSQKSPLLSALLILLVALFGFIIIGPVVGMFLAYPFFEGTPMHFVETLASPLGKPEIKTALYVVQGAATFIGLALVPAFYVFRSQRRNLLMLFKPATVVSLLLVAGIVIFFMGFNSLFIEWNANVQLPGFLSDFENWARDKEMAATQLTKFLTTFDSTGQFVLAFVVIAILPALGEELVFRGLLQPEIFRGTRNIHAAIWISAILFSALHMQFFGFVPRVLLGALFGYLYHWSGNLLIPVSAHFVNNGFSVFMIYLNKSQIAGVDLENPEAAPWPVVLVFSFLTFILLYYSAPFTRTKQPRLDNGTKKILQPYTTNHHRPFRRSSNHCRCRI